MNKITLKGKIISDPYRANEKAPLQIRIETIEHWGGDRKAKVPKEYHNAVLWGKLAEINKGLKKGDLVFVEGPLKHPKREVDVKNSKGEVVLDSEGNPVRVMKEFPEVKVHTIFKVEASTDIVD